MVSQMFCGTKSPNVLRDPGQDQTYNSSAVNTGSFHSHIAASSGSGLLIIERLHNNNEILEVDFAL